jgi:hypothetical protein
MTTAQRGGLRAAARRSWEPPVPGQTKYTGREDGNSLGDISAVFRIPGEPAPTAQCYHHEQYVGNG